MLKRLYAYWVYGGSLAGLLLLALLPVLVHGWTRVLTMTFVCLPAYMVHQLEEHDDDRFRRFFNDTLGKGRELLSPAAVFAINVPGVWGVIGAGVWMVWLWDPGYGLIAAYLLLVNAVMHVAAALVLRGYNPGLVTAVLLFLPVGACCVWAVQQAGGGTLGMHLLGAGTAVAIHAGIIGYVQWRARRLV